MDFQSIENLSNEETLSLYKDVVENGEDNIFISYCACFNGSSYLGAGSMCGAGKCGAWRGQNDYTYCSVQLKTEEQCYNWCRSKGFSVHVDVNKPNDYCFCRAYNGGASWYSCYT